jgi:hypothetical protein
MRYVGIGLYKQTITACVVDQDRTPISAAGKTINHLEGGSPVSS